MNIQPGIEELPEKKLIGIRMKMSFSDNRSFDLWHSFLPRRKEIKNNTGTELYSIEIYPDGFFNIFNPEAQFEKWAAVEVKDFKSVPDEMETIILQEGLYAVFLHKGPASAVPQTYQYILGIWLPQNSNFTLDNRPHFALMGNKYKNEDPDSEEELWIPIKNITEPFLPM
jgi:AraC family transcriptional regulator